MQETKKIILFIVEGDSDKRSLENILDKLLKSYEIEFCVCQGDVLASKNAIKGIKNIIKNNFLNKNPYFIIKDIYQVVHIVDLDSVCIHQDKIIEDKTCNKVRYENECCIVKNKKNILSRNTLKTNHIMNLIQYNNFSMNTHTILYGIYYFSCHLEHVLHNQINCTATSEKKKLSEQFSTKYYNKENEFLDFINNKEFATQLTYQESWQAVMKPENALKRSTNFNLFFKNLKKDI